MEHSDSAAKCSSGNVLRAMEGKTLVECDGHPMAIMTHLGVIRVILKELISANKILGASAENRPLLAHRIRLGTAVELVG
jgi:hypothetical protein